MNFRDKSLIDIINDKNNENHIKVIKCLFLLSLCHTVVAEIKENEIIYNASSPDELALINFAKFCGMEFKGVEGNIMIVDFKGKKHKFKLLHQFDFTSTRKRHSVIVEDENSNIFLF